MKKTKSLGRLFLTTAYLYDCLKVWRSEEIWMFDIWRFAGLQICRFADFNIWRFDGLNFEGLKAWKFEGLKVWRFEGLKVWKFAQVCTIQKKF